KCKVCPAAGAQTDQPVGERKPLAPDVVDHRVVGGGAGIRACDAYIAEQRMGHMQEELHARRSARVAFVIGDLPGPGGVTTAQHDDCGDGGTVEAEARDLDFALAGEPSECRLDEGADTGMIARGSPGAALPARGLEREEIAERRWHLRRFAGDAE